MDGVGPDYIPVKLKNRHLPVFRGRTIEVAAYKARQVLYVFKQGPGSICEVFTLYNVPARRFSGLYAPLNRIKNCVNSPFQSAAHCMQQKKKSAS